MRQVGATAAAGTFNCSPHIGASTSALHPNMQRVRPQQVAVLGPQMSRASLQPAHVQHRLGHNLGGLSVPAAGVAKQNTNLLRCKANTASSSVQYTHRDV